MGRTIPSFRIASKEDEEEKTIESFVHVTFLSITKLNDKLDSNKDNILEKEIESWKSLEYALSDENAIV